MVKGVGRPGKTLLVLLCVIAALVLVSVVVVLTRGTPKPLDASSPAGVVQGYVTAFVAGDEAGAERFLEPGADTRCKGFESIAPERNIRVALISTTQRETTADVAVSISYTNVDGPFSSPEYASEESFGLSLVDGKWLISSAPWPLLTCHDTDIEP
ncbi:hypothetical protein DQ353_13190 [Arthrobacter sp. AQ5-05]|uniref:hypothetical protein n=1 Tax=Arthrobacter sp. AQ5-05 TaxID=2184581 RepID=UPI000DCD7C78|nr:hypothetical protein [Arthrobacter sp. AQ5-05]RAX48870.1 hypothetical protein DQ353_13190 [Arthrobacter sp. AQ5-05]